MSLARVIRSFAAYGIGQVVTVLIQFALPPVFLRAYGVSGYATWVILWTTVAYMMSLNFGVTTYAVNRLTMMRKANDVADFQPEQASAAWMILVLMVAGLALVGVSFALPMSRLLHVAADARTVHLTVMWLALQGLMHVFAGYYNNLFVVCDRPDQAVAWFNYRRLSCLIALPLAVFHSSFVLISFTQFLAVGAVTVYSIFKLRRDAPWLSLSLRGGSLKIIKAAVGPSGLFGLIYLQQFLLFETPLLIFQWCLGPLAVVQFAVCRTIFSTARQALSMVTSAVAPEITFSYGAGDLARLRRIFVDSERMIYTLLPVLNGGVLAVSYVLIVGWTRKPELFDVRLYVLMALVSAVMSVKEHKQWFQFATNQHSRLSWTVFVGTVALIVLGTGLTKLFGLTAFILLWTVSEAGQTVVLLHENRKLLEHGRQMDLAPIFKLLAIVAGYSVFLGFALPRLIHRSLMMQGMVGVATAAVIALISYLVFDMHALAVDIVGRTIGKRFARGTT